MGIFSNFTDENVVDKCFGSGSHCVWNVTVEAVQVGDKVTLTTTFEKKFADVAP